MGAMVSYYPQVSEWIYLGETAINMAQVASIEFQRSGDEEQAIVRLSSYHAGDDLDDRDKTWFKVTQEDLVRALRRYVDGLRAPGFASGSRRHPERGE
jgi:hypothetical protein